MVSSPQTPASGTGSASSAPLSTGQQVFQQAIAACPIISQQDGSGSGVLVRSQGNLYVVTNKHVVLGGEEFVISFRRYVDGDFTIFGELRPTRSALIVSREADVAAFKVESMPEQLRSITPLELAIRTPQIGEPVYVIGYPGVGDTGMPLVTLTDGSVATSIVRLPDAPEFGPCFQITAAINRGNSGGPVLDRNCQVLGIATFYVKNGNSQNFAVAAQSISQLLIDPSSRLTGAEVTALWEAVNAQKAAQEAQLREALLVLEFVNTVNGVRDACLESGFALTSEFPVILEPGEKYSDLLPSYFYSEYRIVCLALQKNVKAIRLSGRLFVFTNPFLPPQEGLVRTKYLNDLNLVQLDAQTRFPAGLPSRLGFTLENRSGEEVRAWIMVFGR
jgi:S1-C subfamily serine protease